MATRHPSPRHPADPEPARAWPLAGADRPCPAAGRTPWAPVHPPPSTGVSHLDQQQGVGSGGVGVQPGIGAGRHHGQIGLRLLMLPQIERRLDAEFMAGQPQLHTAVCLLPLAITSSTSPSISSSLRSGSCSHRRWNSATVKWAWGRLVVLDAMGARRLLGNGASVGRNGGWPGAAILSWAAAPLSPEGDSPPPGRRSGAHG